MMLQSPLTSVCGQYCLYYLLHRARGISLQVILNEFSSDVDWNDQFVYDFIRNRYTRYKIQDTRWFYCIFVHNKNKKEKYMVS